MMGIGGGGDSTDTDDEDETETAPDQTTFDDPPTEAADPADEPDDDGASGSILGGSGQGSGSSTGSVSTSTAPDEEDGDEEQAETEAEIEEKESEDEQESEEAELVVYTDAWDSVGWGIEPVLKRLKKEFGPSFDLSYEVLAPRTFDGDEKEKWMKSADRYVMPINHTVWSEDPPESTELSTRALLVVQKLSQDLFREYLRRLRIAAIVEAKNIEDYDVLLELAAEVGVNTDQFADTWSEVSIGDPRNYEKTPVMELSVGNKTVPWTGNLEYGFVLGALLDLNVVPLAPPIDEIDFVAANAPTPTEEVAEVFQKDRDNIFSTLQESDATERLEFGGESFWEPTEPKRN